MLFESSPKEVILKSRKTPLLKAYELCDLGLDINEVAQSLDSEKLAHKGYKLWMLVNLIALETGFSTVQIFRNFEYIWIFLESLLVINPIRIRTLIRQKRLNAHNEMLYDTE